MQWHFVFKFLNNTWGSLAEWMMVLPAKVRVYMIITLKHLLLWLPIFAGCLYPSDIAIVKSKIYSWSLSYLYGPLQQFCLFLLLTHRCGKLRHHSVTAYPIYCVICTYFVGICFDFACIWYFLVFVELFFKWNPSGVFTYIIRGDLCQLLNV